jgi:hypothetical protein
LLPNRGLPSPSVPFLHSEYVTQAALRRFAKLKKSVTPLRGA